MIESFIRRVVAIARSRFPESVLSIRRKRSISVNIRMEIEENLFVDIYFHVLTRRQDFSVIKKGRRVYGIDNLHGWHIHPLASPDIHVPCSPQNLRAIFAKLAKAVALIGRQVAD